MNVNSVLHVNSSAEQADYMECVAEILRRVQTETKLTLYEIADNIDVSIGTISAAANKKSALNPMYLSRIGKVFGAHSLDPYAALFGGRVVPIHPTGHADVLPFIARAGLRIAEARDPAGPGGEREVHTERFGYLPALLDLQREIGALICCIEAEKAA